jgi:hypothetical protein
MRMCDRALKERQCRDSALPAEEDTQNLEWRMPGSTRTVGMSASSFRRGRRSAPRAQGGPSHEVPHVSRDWRRLLVVIGTPAAAIAAPLTDPTGDANYGATGFVDIVSAQATKSGQTFRFQMSLAAPIPAIPSTPPATNQIPLGLGPRHGSDDLPSGLPLPGGAGPRPAGRVRHHCRLGRKLVLGLADRLQTAPARWGSDHHTTDIYDLRRGCSCVRASQSAR